jgi:adenylyltransferase/sulfurtransferase
MPNPFGAPEVTVQEVKQKLDDGAPVVLLDVREQAELQLAAIHDTRVVAAPLSDIARRYLDALPSVAIGKDAEIVVFCHHGVRSAQVTLWMQSQGWYSVRSMAGGIDAWAKEIDASVGSY